jgi:chromosome segregation ATPase
MGFASCLLLLWVPVAGYCTDTTLQPENQLVTMQRSQYNRLKEIINQQDMTLTQLQVKLSLLKQNSTTQSQTLIELQTQLDNCSAQLILTKSQLTTASDSLTKAEETLKKQEESLQILTKQIKQMEHHASVLQRQRDTYAGLAGLLGAIAIFK